MNYNDNKGMFVDTPQKILGRMNKRTIIDERFRPVEALNLALVYAYGFNWMEAPEISSAAYSIQRSTDVSEAVALRQSIQSYAEKLEREHISTTFSFSLSNVHESDNEKYRLKKIYFDDETMTLFRVGTNADKDTDIRMQTITAVNDPDSSFMRVTEYDLSLERIPTERELRSIFFQWGREQTAVGRLDYMDFFNPDYAYKSIEYTNPIRLRNAFDTFHGTHVRPVIYQSAIDRGDISHYFISTIGGDRVVIEDSPSWEMASVEGEPTFHAFKYDQQNIDAIIYTDILEYENPVDRIELDP